MPTEVSTHTFSKGMNQDLHESMVDQQTSYEIKNFHIVSGETTRTGILENIKGNNFIRDLTFVSTPGTPVKYAGHVCVKDTVIFFVTTNTTSSPNSGTSGMIKVIFDTDNETVSTVSDLYRDDTYCDDGSYLNFSTANKIVAVGRYENESVQKIYWVDGYNRVRYCNIAANLTVSGEVYSGSNKFFPVDRLEFIPDADLPKPVLDDVVSGHIDTGVIQYSYQMYIKNGSETAFAPLSNIIHITNENDFLSHSNDYSGTGRDEESGKGFKIRIDNSGNSTFNRIRIIALHRNSINDVPMIRVATEFGIDENNDTIYYTDAGNSIGQLTLEELSISDTNLFKAETLSSKDNLLFTGNIEMDPFGISSWDSRTYRFNNSQKAKVEESDGSYFKIYAAAVVREGAGGAASLGDWEYFNSSDVYQNTHDDYDQAGYGTDWGIPDSADCINPFNNPDGEPFDVADAYKYKSDGSTLGATGKNLALEFGTSNFEIDDRESTEYSGIGVENVSDNKSYQDYASPWRAGQERSWQRDEVYRVGVVFYDNKMRKSFVHWINDLKIPDSNESTSAYDMIVTGTPVEAMRVYPRIWVNNLPTDAVYYQLARVQRGENDRSIVAQGLISKVDGGNVTSFYNDKSVSTGDLSVKLISPEPLINQNITARANDYIEYIGTYGITNTPDTNGGTTTSNLITWKAIEFDSISKSTGTGTGTWITPTSHENNSGWTDPEKMYDDEFSTYGYASTTDTNITLTHEAMSCSKVRILADGDGGLSGDQADLRIEVFHSGVWNLICNELIPSNVYTEYDIGTTESVTTARLIINNNTLAQVRRFHFWDTAGFSDRKATVDSAKIIGPTASDDSITLGSTTITNYCPDTYVLSYGGTALFIEADLSSWDGTFTDWVTANYRRNLYSIQYGGHTYEERSINEYILGSDLSTTTGAWFNCEIGDTFISYFEYVNLIWDLSKGLTVGDSIKEVVFIPVETSINCNLRHDKCHSDDYATSNVELMQEFAGTHVDNDDSEYEQETDLYQYNTVYSEENDSVKFYALPYDYTSVDLYTNRIKVSESKMNGEVIDSWTKFNVNEYIDVDSAFGDVNNLYLFKDRLMFFQDHAFGILSVNERSLISDNNPGQLVLGTGGVLSRFDYISKDVGNTHKWGLISSQNSLYWFYDNEKALYQYSKAEVPLSKLKGMQSWFNTNFTSGDDIFSVYDNYYNEVLFTIDGTSTIAYSESIEAFTGIYDFIPKAYVKLYNDRYMTLDSDSEDLYLQNSDSANKCTFWGSVTEAVSSIKYFINDNFSQTKVFDNISYSSMASSSTLQDIYNETFDEIRVMNDYQNSDWVTLTYGTNLERRERDWALVVPRDAVSVKEEANTDITAVGNLDQTQEFKKRMRGKYMSTEFKYDNTNHYDLEVSYINTKYRISYR